MDAAIIFPSDQTPIVEVELEQRAGRVTCPDHSWLVALSGASAHLVPINLYTYKLRLQVCFPFQYLLQVFVSYICSLLRMH